MGRKLDLGELGDAECEHILEVLNRDFRLRQQETERLEQQEKELQEEATKTGQSTGLLVLKNAKQLFCTSLN